MHMNYEDLKPLKSGTDVRGVALDDLPGQPVNLTDEAVSAIVSGFAAWLAGAAERPNRLKIAVGRDSRISGPRIRDAVVRTLVGVGVQVVDCGLASTPAMFMTTVDIGCHGAIEITASHHPFNRNGLKFFTAQGGLDSNTLDEVFRMAALSVSDSVATGECVALDYMSQYAARLRNMICDGIKADVYERPLEDMHIIVDAGNGAGGFYAGKVLEPLGARVDGSQFLEPDGRFPNHIPNPENKEAMESICKAVRDSGADLGIIFDTDVDRAACVGAGGQEMGRNRLIALASAIALENGGTVVTDSVTSDGLKLFIEKTLGGVHCRFKRGYKNVINEALRLNAEGVDCPLAIETSGHAAMRENYFLDDGAYLATKIVIKAACLRKEGRTLDDLLKPLVEPAESDEVRLDITAADFRTFGNHILELLELHAHKNGWTIAEDSHEGVRVSFAGDEGGGWILLRLSVHDPVMALNLESNRAGGNKILAAALFDILKEQDGLVLDSLKNYLKD